MEIANNDVLVDVVKVSVEAQLLLVRRPEVRPKFHLFKESLVEQYLSGATQTYTSA